MATQAVGGGFAFERMPKGYDPLYAQAQLETLNEWFISWGADTFYRAFISILRKKDEKISERPGQWNSRLVPYCMNRMQMDMRDTFGPTDGSLASMASFKRRNITLKWRQGGSTTHHIIDRLFVPTILAPGTNGLLISQKKDYAAMHLAILKRAHRYFGRVSQTFKKAKSTGDAFAEFVADVHRHLLHTQYHDKHSLVFDFLDSRITVESAENEEAGQGITLHRVVCSETARWPKSPEETLANVKEAIVLGGTLDIECTPNGMGGYFFEEWQRAKEWPNSEFRPHFYPWWWAEDCEENTTISQEELDEKEQQLVREAGITLKQVQWRRNKMVALRHNFPEKYPEDPVSCFLTSGRPFFDVEVLRNLKMDRMNERPLEVHGNGDYLVYKKRIPGRRYIIGADTAEGKLVSTDNPDFSAAVVLDMDTAEEMASYRARIPPEDFGFELVDIAKSYNNAIIAVERNGGSSVILTIESQERYANVYYFPDRAFLKERPVGSASKGKRQIIRMAGFPTNTKTRRFMLNELSRLVRQEPEFWHDHQFIDECLTFCYNEKSKPEAMAGTHDDSVLCRAVAAASRAELMGWWDPNSSGTEEYGDTGEDDAA